MARSHSTPTVVRQYIAASRKLRKELKDPQKASAFLVSVGLAEKCSSAPNGIKLAKRYR